MNFQFDFFLFKRNEKSPIFPFMKILFFPNAKQKIKRNHRWKIGHDIFCRFYYRSFFVFQTIWIYFFIYYWMFSLIWCISQFKRGSISFSSMWKKTIQTLIHWVQSNLMLDDKNSLSYVNIFLSFQKKENCQWIEFPFIWSW